ncbi:MAG TPA: alpha/beta family hydrolase [Gaiellaceae bacterium]|nr:alpha/beta family hydrolase [Gaiellaceae bacterium]
MSIVELETPFGPARAHLRPDSGDARAALVLGHGAGGGVDAPDLRAATRAAEAAGARVVLVEQPYRVAGRRSAAPAAQLDAAWIAVIAELRAGPLRSLPLVTGGRSSGARVACRTAAVTGADGVLCLAFPLRPPGREVSRLDELKQVSVPVLVVQGRSDPFGMPRSSGSRTVVRVPGDHSLRAGLAEVEQAVSSWLSGRLVASET